MNTTLQVRVNAADKALAQKYLKKVGMDLSTGVNTFIKQVGIMKGLPFRPTTVSGYNLKAEAAILKASTDLKRGKGRSFKGVDDLFSYLNK